VYSSRTTDRDVLDHTAYPLKGKSDGNSVFDTDALTENPCGADPAVHVTAVVADLKSLTLDCFHNVKKLIATHFPQHDVINAKG
jgi:hypothetical protein